MSDKKPSIEELRAKAESGDPIAQNELGLLYAKGDGVDKDLVQAKKLFYKASIQGLADAQFHLGWCYESGKGTEAKPKEAFKWYRMASYHGHSKAQFSLSRCYRLGLGVQNDNAKMMEYLQKSAQSGYGYAQYYLGYNCLYSHKSEFNKDDAYHWLKLAQKNGYDNSKFHIGICLIKGIGVKKNVDRGVKLIEDSAYGSNGNAALYLGDMFKEGDFLEANALKMEDWYQLAYDLGEASGMTRLAECYMKGRLVPKDNNKAIRCYKLAADKNDFHALLKLSQIYAKGDIVPKNYTYVLEIHKKMYHKYPDPILAYDIGEQYYYGKGIKRNYPMAFKWFNKAGNIASYMLAQCYRYGYGTVINEVKSYELMHEAANDGDEQALKGLTEYYVEGKGTKKDYKEAYIVANICHAWDDELVSDDQLRELKSHLSLFDIDDAEKQAYEQFMNYEPYLSVYKLNKVIREKEEPEKISFSIVSQEIDPFKETLQSVVVPKKLTEKYLLELKKLMSPAVAKDKSTIRIHNENSKVQDEFNIIYNPNPTPGNQDNFSSGFNPTTQNIVSADQNVNENDGGDSSASKSAINYSSQKLHRSGLDYSSWKVGTINEIKLTFYLRDANITLSYKNKKDTQPADKLFSVNSLRLLILAYDFLKKGHSAIRKTENTIASAAYPNKDMADCIPNNRVVTYFNSDFRKLFGLAKKDKAFDWDGGKYNSHLVANFTLEVKP